MKVPEFWHSVSIQCRPLAGGNWATFKTINLKATPSEIRVSLPASFALQSWRAVGSRVLVPSAKRKYPPRFFSGKKSFAESVATSYSQDAPGPQGDIVRTGQAGVVALASAAPAAVASPSTSPDAKSAAPSTSAVEESDIWKADGSTVYFFNQLRGLQVIDLSDPANPVLRASLRLPAKGQDLYIVPGPGSTRYAVLLTQEYGTGTTGVKLVKVDGPSAGIVAEISIPGWMADSRMAGNRLYLAAQQWTWDGSGVSKDAVVLNEVSVDPLAGKLIQGATHTISGSWPVISAGKDWLAVSAGDWNDWQSTKITLFSLGDNGATRLTASPVNLFGRLYSKFNVQYDGTTLSAVSQRWVSDPEAGATNAWWWNGTQVTKLENFTASGSALASLEVIRGENLEAVRFDGDKAYVVTFRQVDPLFVIDLSEPVKPQIAGQLEVPGWSTQIVPVGGDKLFTIGFGSDWKVCASLFDVTDPAKPSLLSRVSMSSNWGWSPATYDDKALKVLPEHGLVLVPYTDSSSTNGVPNRFVQLLELDAKGGGLTLSGRIDHDFDALRADVVGSSLASISQRELVTADVSKPSSPAVLADILLAWPVNRVLCTTGHMIQIEDGSSPYWWGWNDPASAVARISPLSDADSVLGEIPLGSGVVKDAVLRGKSLYVLRQDPADVSSWWWSARSDVTTPSPMLTVDIYDASKLPDLKLQGTSSLRLPGNDPAWDLSGLLFPSSGSAVVVAQPATRGFRWPGPGIVPLPAPMPLLGYVSAPKVAETSAADARLACCIAPGFYPNARSTNPPVAVMFSIGNPQAPAVQPALPLTDAEATKVISPSAGGGLLVYGYAIRETPIGDSGSGWSSGRHVLRILDLNDISAPVLGPPIPLPGRLLAATDITPEGFLTWTQTRPKSRSGDPEFQVGASDLSAVSQITSLSLTNVSCTLPDGRNLFVVQGNSLAGFSVGNTGVLSPAGRVDLDWSPSSLSAPVSAAGTLLGADWGHLLKWSYRDAGAKAVDWSTERPADLRRVWTSPDGPVLSPAGEYGVDEYRP